ncbi:S-layer homology domain-containing protein [Lysinibacillus sp. NPDC047702]|uniref:S-layer homology domain-containing protein n=1 Tax=unclassified Lysinibacillus TaxID=2636778 RepID=UPI003D086304
MRAMNQYLKKILIWSVVVLLSSFTMFSSQVLAANEWFQLGNGGSELGDFGYPNSVTTDTQGNIYVADSDNNRIQKLDIATGVWSYWGNSNGKEGSALGEFNYPADVAVDSQGNIYVADKLNHRIQKLDVATGVWSKWGKEYQGPNVLDNASGINPGEFHNPSGVAVDPLGNVYVADTTNQRIQKLDILTDQWIVWGRVNAKNLPLTGNSLGEFKQPAGIAVDHEGNIYVADTGNHRIQKVKLIKNSSENGAVSHTYEWSEWKKIGGGSGGELGEFSEPFNLEIDEQGNVYVADSNNNRIQKLTISTNEWRMWGKADGSEGSELGEFSYPTGVTVDHMGSIYVADFGNSRIQKFTALFFTVKFDSQGGSQVVDYENIPNNTKIHRPSSPTRNGYIFDGWYKDSLLQEAWDFDADIVAENQTLYAKWEEAPTFSIESIDNQILSELLSDYRSGTQESKTISIRRSGTADLENISIVLSGTNADSFELTEPLLSKLDKDHPVTTFSIKAKNRLPVGNYYASITIKAKNMVDMTFNIAQVVKAPSSGYYPSSPIEPPITSVKKEIFINVLEKEGKRISNTVISRTTESNGQVKDKITITPESAKEVSENLTEMPNNFAYIIIPDEKDEVAETMIEIPRLSLASLNTGISIRTVNGAVMIPHASLSSVTDNLYFRLVPVKTAKEKSDIENRMKQEEKIRQIAAGKNTAVEVLGRPLTIETNMQSRPVTLVLPLPANLTQAQIEHLAIFIEHSNGTKELVYGRITQFDEILKGIEFDVNHFSTFTILYIEEPEKIIDIIEEDMSKEEKAIHYPYIQGYSDGTFRPNLAISRQQMAAMLARNLTQNEVPVAHTISYRDIQQAWAYDEIEYVRDLGLMTGTADNTFTPNGTITRAQMAVIAMRWIDRHCLSSLEQANYCKSMNEAKEFIDVSKKHWAADSIKRISQLGIMTGVGDGTFRPEQKLTRAQAVKVLNHLFERGPIQMTIENKFRDITPGHWAFYEIQEAAVEHEGIDY